MLSWKICIHSDFLSFSVALMVCKGERVAVQIFPCLYSIPIELSYLVL